MFQVYTGLAYSDVKALREEHISHGIAGKNWIIKNSQTTKKESRMPIINKAQSILDKHAANSLSDDGLLPMASISYYNRKLTEVAMQAAITKNISSHTG